MIIEEGKVRERIDKLLELKDVSIRMLSDGDESLRVRLQRQINGESGITLSTILYILGYFDNLSSEWLLKGKFPVFLDESNENEQFRMILNNELVESYKCQIESLKEVNQLLREKVSRMEAEKNMEGNGGLSMAAETINYNK